MCLFGGNINGFAVKSSYLRMHEFSNMELVLQPDLNRDLLSLWKSKINS